MSVVQEVPRTLGHADGALEQGLEQYRVELTGYCYRMLASPFEAEEAVQETLIRAWRGFDRFEGRAGAVRGRWISGRRGNRSRRT